MGFYSLARCQQVQVTSWPRHGQPWRGTLDERHFQAGEPAIIEPIEPMAIRRSVRQVSTAPPSPSRCLPTKAGESRTRPPSGTRLATAAQHLSIPVRFNGDPLEQQDFLSNAAAVHHWQGIRIGVYPHNRYQPNANFHGITVRCSNLPQVKSVHSTWSVAIDIVNCDQLTLTLPARKEFVETPFLAQLRDQCRRAIYQTIRDLEDNPAVPYQVQQDAASLGVTLPDPPALLPPWEPANADYNQGQPWPPYQWPALPDRAIIVEADCEAPDQQILARAADQNHLLHRLVQAQPIFEGYSWYDRLPRLTGFNFAVTDPDKTTILKHDREENDTPATVRQPDAITCQLTIRHPNRSEPERLALSTDVVFLADLDCEHEPTPLITADSRIRLQELVDLMLASFFSPGYDATDDSYDTQLDNRRSDYHRIALDLLCSEPEAIREAIMQNLHNLRFLVKDGYQATIILNPKDKPQVEVSATN